VILRYEEKRLIVRVCDDGKGIRTEALERQQHAEHWGLQGSGSVHEESAQNSNCAASRIPGQKLS